MKLKQKNAKDLQEVFDIVSEHLLTQNEKSLSKEGYCFYRSSNNKKCAVGCLIPDDLYTPDIECMGADSYEVLTKTNVSHILDIKEFLVGVQDIHDSFEPLYWKSKLKQFANKWNLEWKFEDFITDKKL